MKEEKSNKQNKKEKEECPLCKISEDTLKKLKESKNKKTKDKSAKKMKNREIENNELIKRNNKEEKKPSRKFKGLFLVFILVAVGFVFYQISPKFFFQSGGKENSIPGQSEEKKGSILDIFKGGSEVGDLAPDFVSEDVYGNKISLSDFRDKKPVLLVFWATWCGYCAKELPDLKSFTKKYQNEIQVIAVSSGENRETLQNYIEEKDVNFLMLLDEKREIWNNYLVRGTPSHFLINKEGKIVTLRPGLTSEEGLEIMMTMLTEL